MKITNFIFAPIINYIICRDSLDCPQNHICVNTPLFLNFCKEIKPTYRPSYVPLKFSSL